MRNVLNYSALIFTFMFAFSSCQNKEDATPITTVDLDNNLRQGTWRITLFNDNGNDETAHFTGYEFNFFSEDSVRAVKNTNTVTGKWSSGTDNSQLKINLNFGSTVYFEDLNDDWHVIEQSSTIIKLDDVSGGGGGTDYLTFEKI